MISQEPFLYNVRTLSSGPLVDQRTRFVPHSAQIERWCVEHLPNGLNTALFQLDKNVRCGHHKERANIASVKQNLWRTENIVQISCSQEPTKSWLVPSQMYPRLSPFEKRASFFFRHPCRAGSNCGTMKDDSHYKLSHELIHSGQTVLFDRASRFKHWGCHSWCTRA